MVSADISSLINDIGKGEITESAIRSRLALIEDQAKAQETELEKANADLKHTEKRITELEVKLHEQEQPAQGDELKKDTKRLLKFFFDNAGGAYLEHAANELVLAKSLADYHADILMKAEMIELAAITQFGTRFVLTPKGRAYIMENTLA